MAGEKRPLTELDPNVNAVQPEPKRQATQSPTGKENATPSYTNLMKGELIELLRSCHLKISGTKPELIQGSNKTTQQRGVPQRVLPMAPALRAPTEARARSSSSS